jgi:tRNA nucleotidyltransferase/poly(A) polymerase
MSIKETLKLVEEIANKNLIGKPYIVGGLPRDLYLKIPVKTTDVDLTTNSSDVLRLGILSADKLNCIFDISEDAHMTVFADGFDLDFSSNFISDDVVKFLDGKYKGLEETFSRDFTINTLLQDLVTGQIFDPTEQGFEDIENKIIRTPVPASITLTDDPRRVYRAINLAVRYGFDIDQEIKDFVIESPELFSSKNIKDKYTLVKVNKSLKQNEELTIKLLKELNLFKSVPLAGHFKDVLIKRKLLEEYLNNEKKVSTASKWASSWPEYSAQGPEYKDIELWWKNNFNKFLNSDESYQSWSSWYMDKFKNEWGHKHKSPQETMEIMAGEQSSTAPLAVAPMAEKIKERTHKLLDLFKPIDKDKRLQDRAKKYTPISGGKVVIKPQVDVENVTDAVKEFLNELGIVAEQIGAEIPIVTSGHRSIRSQIRIMGNNWTNNGGLNGGSEYLENLYGENGKVIADIFESYGLSDEAIDLGEEYWKKQGYEKGYTHVANPAKAVDLSRTSGISEVLEQIKSSGKFDMSIGDETGSAGPHYHVKIKSSKTVASNRNTRMKKISKLTPTN